MKAVENTQEGRREHRGGGREHRGGRREHREGRREHGGGEAVRLLFLSIGKKAKTALPAL